MSPRCELEITPGFVLLAAWFALVNGGRTLALVLSAAAIHELGHWLVLRALRAKVYGFRISVLGAELAADSGGLSYCGELAAVLAGPAANLAAALLLTALGGSRWPAAIGAHLVLGGFNLLPIRPLDGGRAVCLAVSWLAGPEAGERALRLLSALTATLFAALLAWVICAAHGSLWLLPALLASLCEGASFFLPPVLRNIKR